MEEQILNLHAHEQYIYTVTTLACNTYTYTCGRAQAMQYAAASRHGQSIYIHISCAWVTCYLSITHTTPPFIVQVASDYNNMHI